MDTFFKYENLKELLCVFQRNGVCNKSFFTLGDEDICNMLFGNSKIFDFISKYSFEKDVLIAACKTNQLAEMDVDGVNDISMNRSSSDLDNQIVNVSSNITLQSTENLPEEVILEECFSFVENDLHQFLKSSFEGNLVLEKYMYTRELYYSRLKDLVIIHKIKEDPIKYRIPKEYFKQISEQAYELFPTEDPDLFYIPRSTEDNDESCAKGCFYNHYKFVRAELRLARKLPKKVPKDSGESAKTIDSEKFVDEFLICLTDPNRDKYSSGVVIDEWKESFSDRANLLDLKEKNVKLVLLTTYFNSFLCLDDQLAFILLESDFKATIKQLVDDDLLTLSPGAEVSIFDSLFSKKWSTVGDVICAKAKKSKNINVKPFVVENNDLLKGGEQNSLLALFLLPLSIQASKTYTKDNQVTSLTKNEICQCFILHVEDPDTVDTAVKKHEKWLRERTDIFPYLVFCGSIPCTKFYVVINGVKYSYSSATAAAENCYKCITALRRLRFFCDFVWSFIEKYVYKFTFKKTISAHVTQYGVKIKKLLKDD